jgi:NDP-sugar pyrophosphorylase family protein
MVASLASSLLHTRAGKSAFYVLTVESKPKNAAVKRPARTGPKHRIHKKKTIPPVVIMKSTCSIAEQIVSLPVVCLATANYDLKISDVIEGKNTVIGTLCYVQAE